MSAGEIRLSSVVALQFTIKNQDAVIVDVSTASSKKVYLTKPTGEKLTKTAVFVTNGVDGQIQYTTDLLDLDMVGETWKAQAEVTLGGVVYKSDIQTFTVYENL